MDKLNIPSYNSLFIKSGYIKAIQELYQSFNGLADSSMENVLEDQLFSNTVPVEQQKQAALMQVLMLEQMYGYTSTTSTDPEYESVILDSEDRIIAGKKVNGKIELFGVEYD